jgi:protoheme IX farnesyltransferase
MAYLDLIKPGETSLLTFTGIAAALIAAGGKPPLSLLGWIFLALLAGSAAVNGLTNYIDRDIDALMERTKYRALPSGRIYPPQKSLPFLLSLLVIGLVVAWLLNPLCFLFGVIGALLAVVARKTAATHLLGTLSSTSPLLIGWIAVTGSLNVSVLVLAILIVFWVPIHAWSLMLAYREDFLQAGVKIFPLNRPPIAKRITFILACLLA